jgi:hypothetical protein
VHSVLPERLDLLSQRLSASEQTREEGGMSCARHYLWRAYLASGVVKFLNSDVLVYSVDVLSECLGSR